MNGKVVGGVVCLVLAAMSVLGAILKLSNGRGPAVDDASGLGVSYTIGTFLPGVILAIVGLWLLKKPEPKKRIRDDDDDDDAPRRRRRRRRDSDD